MTCRNICSLHKGVIWKCKVFRRQPFSNLKPGNSYYDILGVPKSATSIEIKEAYINLVKKYHPDATQTQNAEKCTEKENKEKFLEVQQAFSILCQSNLRAQYDRALHSRTAFKPNGSNFRSFDEELWKFQMEELEKIRRYREGRGEFAPQSNLPSRSKTPILMLVAAVIIGALILHVPRMLWLRSELHRYDRQQELIHNKWKHRPK